MEIRMNYLDFYTPEEWKLIIEDWEKSGLSIYAYCKKRGINSASFCRWKWRFNPYSPITLKESKGKWESLIKDWEKSELNSHVYCKQRGISLSVFRNWRCKLDPSSYRSIQDIRNNWKELIEEWQKSDLTKRAYCMEKEIDSLVFSKWERRLNLSPPLKTALEKWTEIVEDWKKSGLEKAVYCRKKKLSAAPFNEWERKIHSDKSSQPLSDCREHQPEGILQSELSIPAFHSAHPNVFPCPNSKVEIVLSQGHKLILEGSLDWKKLNLWLVPLLKTENQTCT